MFIFKTPRSSRWSPVTNYCIPVCIILENGFLFESEKDSNQLQYNSVQNKVLHIRLSESSKKNDL